jgi:hypothetical protein
VGQRGSLLLDPGVDGCTAARDHLDPAAARRYACPRIRSQLLLSLVFFIKKKKINVSECWT